MVVVPAEPKPNACDAVVLEPNDPKEKPGVSYRKKQTKTKQEKTDKFGSRYSNFQTQYFSQDANCHDLLAKTASVTQMQMLHFK